MSLTLRNVKGSPLTYTEMDDNLTYLEGLSTTGNTLANTLSIGNTTSGNDMELTVGDKIFNTDGTTTSGIQLDPNYTLTGTRFFTQDSSSFDTTQLSLGIQFATFQCSSIADDNIAILEFDPTGGFGSTRFAVENGTTSASSGIFLNNIVENSLEILCSDGTDTLKIRLEPTILKITGLPTYADNAAAISGGLNPDDVYKTSTGELRIVI